MLIPILVTILVIILSAVLMFKKQLVSSKSRSFIITGPMSVGKTCAFKLLTGKQIPELTLTSIEQSEGELVINDAHDNTINGVTVYDFPGNHKLKNLLMFPHLKEHLNETIGVIYIIDSSQLSNEKIREIAYDLIELFKITETKPNGVDLLVFCNKCDLFTSKKKLRIKELLQDEIKQLIKLDSKNLTNVNETNDDSFIHDNANNFQFQNLEGNVTFEEGNLWKDAKRANLYAWLLEKCFN